MNIKLRREHTLDYEAVFQVIEEAFKAEPMSDHQEQFLVERLRKSLAFVPELSIVAELRDSIVGHIILTKILIREKQANHESLALAPVSVLPKYQNKGIGGKLINHAHEEAKKLGFKSVVLLGHDQYYPRFGYRQADSFGIELPFDVPKQYCMATELVEDGLKHVKGMVEYPKEFAD